MVWRISGLRGCGELCDAIAGFGAVGEVHISPVVCFLQLLPRLWPVIRTFSPFVHIVRRAKERARSFWKNRSLFQCYIDNLSPVIGRRKYSMIKFFRYSGDCSRVQPFGRAASPVQIREPRGGTGSERRRTSTLDERGSLKMAVHISRRRRGVLRWSRSICCGAALRTPSRLPSPAAGFGTKIIEIRGHPMLQRGPTRAPAANFTALLRFPRFQWHRPLPSRLESSESSLLHGGMLCIWGIISHFRNRFLIG